MMSSRSFFRYTFRNLLIAGLLSFSPLVKGETKDITASLKREGSHEVYFDSLFLEKGVEVKLQKGEETRVEVMGNKEDLDKIKITIKGCGLCIERKRCSPRKSFQFMKTRGMKEGGVTIFVTVKDTAHLKSLFLRKNANLTVNHFTTKKNLFIEVEKGSKVEGEIEAKALQVSAEKGARVFLKVKGKTFILEGSSNTKSFLDLEVKQVLILLNGGSEVKGKLSKADEVTLQAGPGSLIELAAYAKKVTASAYYGGMIDLQGDIQELDEREGLSGSISYIKPHKKSKKKKA